MANESLIPTICPYCGVGCGFYIALEDGKEPRIEYMPDHIVNEGALCPKGNAALEAQNHPERLRHPLKKTEDGWAEISWEEALDLVSEKLKETLEAHGPHTIGFLGSAKITNEENYIFQKMARLLGISNVDNCARLCHSPTIYGLERAFGLVGVTNPFPDLANSGCILVIGSNLAENHPLVTRWILKAKDRGATVIVVDPRLTPTAWLADQHLQIDPGTDVVLLNGMMRVILKEGLADTEFVTRQTVGFEDLVGSLEEYTPEKVAEVAGVSVAGIVKAARSYARSPASSIVYSMGVTQHAVGTDNVTACANLALICGQVGRPGAGIYPLRGQNNVQGACDMGMLPDFYPGGRRIDDPGVVEDVEDAWGASHLPTAPGLTAVEMIEAAYDGDLRILYVVGENPINSGPNTDRAREALGRLEFMIVQDIFMTETAQMADLVLPAALWAEKDGTFTSTERRVQQICRAADPPGDAREDLWIFSQVAGRLGLGLHYAGPDDVLTEINRVLPSYGGVTRERLTSPGGLIWPCPYPGHPGTPILHTEGFSTPDGRGRIVPVDYKPPAEVTDQEYPLVLTTGRVVLHYNAGSMTRRSPSLAGRVPELFVEVNPHDAEKLEIEEGDFVTVTTVRGRILARADLTERVGPGVVFLPFHFPDTNRLTTDVLDPVAKIPEFKVAACRIGRG